MVAQQFEGYIFTVNVDEVEPFPSAYHVAVYTCHIMDMLSSIFNLSLAAVKGMGLPADVWLVRPCIDQQQ